MELLTIVQLSNTDFERHLRIFSKRIPIYATIFQISEMELELIHRHAIAYTWAIQMNTKLMNYLKDIKLLTKSMREQSNRPLSAVNFIDLPRPPVFYMGKNIDYFFFELLIKIKRSPMYTNIIGEDLGINLLFENRHENSI